MEILFLIIGILSTSCFFLIREIRLRSQIRKFKEIFDSNLDKFKEKIYKEVDEHYEETDKFMEEVRSHMDEVSDDMFKNIREQFDENMEFREEIWTLLSEDEHLSDKISEIRNKGNEEETEEEVEKKVNYILEKISEHGINSLSSEELKILKKSNHNKGK